MSSIEALKAKNSKLEIWKIELNSGLITIYHKLNDLQKSGPQVRHLSGQLDRLNYTLLCKSGVRACKCRVKGPVLHECNNRIANVEIEISGLHKRFTSQLKLKLKGCCTN